jgi:hypothetical protein
MTLKLPRALTYGLLLLGTAATPVLCLGQGSRPIQYSEPRGANNTPETLLPGRTRLDQLEAELNRPFKSMFQGKSLDGMIMPAPQPVPPPVIQQPRFKEKDDKQRDWMFLKPEEMYPVKTPEDLYKAPELTPDGRKVSDLRPMERRYLELQDQRRTEATNSMNAPAWSLGANPYQSTLGGLVPGLVTPNSAGGATDLERGLRQVLTGSEIPQSKSGDDLFGMNNGYRPPSKLTDAEIQKRDAYMQILDYNNTRGDVKSSSGSFSTRWVDSSFYDPPKLPTPTPAATPSLGGSLSGGTVSPNMASTWTPTITPPPPVKPLPAPTSASPFISPRPRNSF